MCGPLSQPARKRARRLIEWGRRMPPLDGCSEAPHKKRLGEQKNRVPLLLGESSNWKKVKGTKCALICLPPVDDNGPNRCWREMDK